MQRTLPVVFLAVLCCAATATSQVALSQFLGPRPFAWTSGSNVPFTRVNRTSPWGFGVDCPGSYRRARINFLDRGTFEHGVGMHPTQNQWAEIEFDIGAIAQELGQRPTRFQAWTGIDTGSGGSNGARFTVFLDNRSVSITDQQNMNASSQRVDVSLTGARTLKLRTQVLGAWFTNHACWGGARLVVPFATTAPSTVTLPQSFNVDAAGGTPNGLAVLLVTSIDRSPISPIVFPLVRLDAAGRTSTPITLPSTFPKFVAGFQYWSLDAQNQIVKSNESIVRLQ